MRALLAVLLIALSAATQAQPTVTTPPASCSWCDIQVTWSGIAAPNPGGDRFALVTAGSPLNSTWHNWRFTNGAASGTLPLGIPGNVPFGSYQIRLYNVTSANLIATSAPFLVQPTVSGQATAGGSALAGVAVSATNGVQCSTTDASGWYGCLVPYGWTGTITPSKPGHLFNPASRNHTNVTNHIQGHFPTAASHAVTGTIAVGGSPLANVAIAGTNGASCTSTNASGQYTCAVLPGWSGSVTPSLANHTFAPTSRSYTNVTSAQASQGYTAEHFPIVSGTTTVNGAPLAGVTLTATNGVTCTTSNASGQYSCIAPPGWSGSVTPTLGAYSFAPASRSYTSIATHQSAQDFATGIFQLSGTVTVNSQPLGGVSVSATNGTTCSVTNASGQYTCTALAGWTGTISPALSGYMLTPSSRNYTNVLASAAAEDYSAAVNTGTARVFFIHADHLNTPRLVSDATGTAVWRWDQQEPFGVNVPDENPSALGAFEFPLRFPGQYADSETSLYYNYFRDYDAAIGRYVESDPVGLRGGVNTYAYANHDPLSFIDPRGNTALVGVGAGAGSIIGGPPGAIVGAGVGLALSYAIYNAATSSDGESSSEPKALPEPGETTLSPTDQRQKEWEKKRYDNRCDEQPPSDLTGCALLYWKLNKAKQCRSDRDDFTKKWYGGWSDPGHAQYMAELNRHIRRMEWAILRMCCK
jgi:RHS repeat-associated protein